MSLTCPNGHPSTATDYCDTCGAPMPTTVGGAGSSGAGSPGPGSGPAPATPGVGSGPSVSAASAVMPGAPVGPQECPHCQTSNLPDALFCEACGYDFTTGAMPRAAGSASSLDLGPAGTQNGTGSSGVAGATGPVGAAGTTGPGGAAGPTPLAPSVPVEWVVEAWVDPDWYALQDSEETCPSPGLPTTVPLAVRSVLVGRTSRSRSIHPEVDCDGDVGVSRRQAQLTTDGTRWWVEDLQSSNGTYVGPASGPLPTEPITPGQRRELAEGDRVYVGAWTRLVVRRATDEEKAGTA